MTSPEQRKSFRAHILNAVDDSLQTIDASPDTKGANGEEQPMEEDINIDIEDDEPAPEGFIDIEDDKKKKQKEEPQMSPEEQFGQPLSDSARQPATLVPVALQSSASAVVLQSIRRSGLE